MTRLSFLLFIATISCSSCIGYSQISDSKPVTHELWDQLLKQHVSEDGQVDYAGFKADEDALQEYLDLLGSAHPNEDNWSSNERLAYWINAYNSFTVKLILNHYPVESIKDIKKGIPMINSVWDIKFIEIEGESYDLNNIEHSILRKEFEEPRIHFAINCASVSCPDLRPEAYNSEDIERQLDEQTTRFLTDPSKNRISINELKLSKIFSWFKGDFTKNGSLVDFIDAHSDIDIDEKAIVSYLDYDWNLNGK